MVVTRGPYESQTTTTLPPLVLNDVAGATISRFPPAAAITVTAGAGAPGTGTSRPGIATTGTSPGSAPVGDAFGSPAGAEPPPSSNGAVACSAADPRYLLCRSTSTATS